MTAQSQHDLPLCDLVMKGGATSGVVYPPAIAQLAEKYRFANIGGTSAGAIAASVTAAAEYGRQRGHLEDFTALNGLSNDMSEPGKLLSLFRSTAPANLLPLLDTLLPLVSDPTAASGEPVAADSGPLIPPLARQIAPELLDLLFPPKPAGSPAPDDQLGKSLRTLISSLPEHHPSAYQIGSQAGGQAGVRIGQYLIYGAVILALLFAIPIVLVGITWLAGIIWVALSVLLIGAAYLIGQRVGQMVASTSGTVVAVADLARMLLNDVPQNLYGICTGRQQPDSPENEPGLTDWLSDWIGRMAGPTDHSGPLTFGDLQQQDVTLQMVTTNLSHGRPYVLPFASDFILFFRRGDIERLFPIDVVDYMCQDDHIYPGWVLDDLNANRAADDPNRFYMLPNSDDLPVIVAMRMSMSFPLLISAVRLYTVSGSCPQDQGIYRPRRSDLQPNWFSDGGICSNFPIHFFDQWLPTHPTFGINLTGMPKEAFAPDPYERSGATPGAKGDPSTGG
ncbi:MAG: patatin-like phospholipase family protein, partial [Roseiflexaceae bacterium]|nr:patatin-like phospholipase family protein [Roseiflexaceae bacterium]